MVGLEAIKKKMKADPNYTKEDAIREWVKLNPNQAVGLAQQIWPDYDPDSCPMDYDLLEDYLGTLNPVDAFMTGFFSASNDFSLSDDYY